MSFAEKIRKELRKMWSESDTEMIMSVVEEVVAELEAKNIEYAKLVAGQAEKYAEEWTEHKQKLQDICLLIRDAYNQLELGEKMDMLKLGSSIRVAFKEVQKLLEELEK